MISNPYCLRQVQNAWCMKIALQRVERNFGPVGNAATSAANATDATISTSNIAVLEDIMADIPAAASAVVRGSLKNTDFVGKVRKHTDMWQMVDYRPDKTNPTTNTQII